MQQTKPRDHWTFFAFPLVEIREAFRVLDRDGNGFISKQELGMAMRSLGYMPSEVELAIIMQRLDMDGEPWACSGAPRDEPRLISETLPLKGLALGVKRLGFMSWFTFEG